MKTDLAVANTLADSWQREARTLHQKLDQLQETHSKTVDANMDLKHKAAEAASREAASNAELHARLRHSEDQLSACRKEQERTQASKTRAESDLKVAPCRHCL